MNASDSLGISLGSMLLFISSEVTVIKKKNLKPIHGGGFHKKNLVELIIKGGAQVRAVRRSGKNRIECEISRYDENLTIKILPGLTQSERIALNNEDSFRVEIPYRFLQFENRRRAENSSPPRPQKPKFHKANMPRRNQHPCPAW